MAFVAATTLVTLHRRPPQPRRVAAMAASPAPRGGDGGLPRTAWVAAPATAATAARAAARVGSGSRRSAAVVGPPATATAPEREAVDEAALRAADIQEALADLAELRCRVMQGEERLGSPATVRCCSKTGLAGGVAKGAFWERVPHVLFTAACEVECMVR